MTKLIHFFVVLITCAPVAAFGMGKGMAINTDVRHFHPRNVKPVHEYRTKQLRMSSPISMVANIPRGGSIVEAVKSFNKSPSSLFNSSLVTLAIITAAFKILQRASSSNSAEEANKKPKSVRDLQLRFLSVFWLLRCADWLQGPYFYEVYSSKVFNGVPASIALVSKLFLTGFASTALFGPLVGRALDAYGRKKGTLAFAVIYALGAASTKSPLLKVLFLGRIMSGIGTSLLFSAPESWLVAESQSSGDDPTGSWLGETFGLAYAGDALVAILAGQFAGVAAGARGPTGPFELSAGFLALGGLLTALLWKENIAKGSDDDGVETSKPSIKDAIEVIKKDPKIMLVGGVQSLFEAAMYIFVLQWPPAISSAVAKAFGEGAGTPFGTVFSCFMACCLFGSTLFGQLAKMSVPTEKSTAGMLSVAAIAMSSATFAVSSSTSLAALVAAFFVFEACVGMYFPSIGTLRSKYVPDSHRSVIMNLFGIPLNVLVVSVFLSISKLGLKGALGISSGALALAAICMLKLNTVLREKAAA
mmetsp:Transcript_11260/g.27085  ORF Transcript_11260/g.27085 Transcript_11260/m.27085 type:complete len:531 (-) Transcript_11260:98-1690(-)|eukprot:CAMPEP_0113620560 /NCGR_PEP_ID=MMETSP0017_2-20120614/10480_1 /TAXON_ID=2856 /ORGANISM="Cylindrotheca closterium" /LENGTH=530 /DNA_ID=CAMNT_0000530233 /DNA_START=88 /DNA_END=1680 /DNA_ORIENTATION=+ /assembly_acc=CAM_ASM_000147